MEIARSSLPLDPRPPGREPFGGGARGRPVRSSDGSGNAEGFAQGPIVATFTVTKCVNKGEPDLVLRAERLNGPDTYGDCPTAAIGDACWSS
jgi:hypothetical protein